MNIKAKPRSESRNKSITSLSSVPRLSGHIYSLQLHQVYTCKWRENNGKIHCGFHFLNFTMELLNFTVTLEVMSPEPSFKPLPPIPFRPRAEIYNRKLTQPRRVCIFDIEKREFCTLCTCIFHFWTCRRCSRSFHDVNDLFCSCVDDVRIWRQMFNFVFLYLDWKWSSTRLECWKGLLLANYCCWLKDCC